MGQTLMKSKVTEYRGCQIKPSPYIGDNGKGFLIYVAVPTGTRHFNVPTFATEEAAMDYIDEIEPDKFDVVMLLDKIDRIVHFKYVFNLLTEQEREALWAIMLGGVQDIHSTQDQLTDDHWDAAELITKVLTDLVQADQDRKKQ